jgi:NTP pyrophosphatase (non-canonical NTP hydrolase)
MNDATTTVSELMAALADFNAARDWGRFHTPRDLAMALSIEASELLELFLWKEGPADLPARERLREELGDVMICLVNLAAKSGVDLMAAAADKLAKNAEKYPVAMARGSAKKWNELEPTHAKEPDPSR